MYGTLMVMAEESLESFYHFCGTLLPNWQVPDFVHIYIISILCIFVHCVDFMHICFACIVETVADELSQAKHISSLRIPFSSLQKALDPIAKIQQENSDRLTALQGQLLSLQQQMQMSSRATFNNSSLFGSRDLFVIAVALLAQLFLFIWFK